MFGKRESLKYNTCSPAREEFLMEIESVFEEKGIKCSRTQLYDLVEAYSSSDTVKMSRIFIDIINSI